MRSDASQLYQSVSDGQDISVLSYHGDMPHKRRTENLEAFSTVCSLACPTSPPGSEHHAVPSAPSPTVLRCPVAVLRPQASGAAASVFVCTDLAARGLDFGGRHVQSIRAHARILFAVPTSNLNPLPCARSRTLTHVHTNA